jgi:thiamine monophosphate synthase
MKIDELLQHAQIRELIKITHEAGTKLYQLRDKLINQSSYQEDNTLIIDLCKRFDQLSNSLESILTNQEFERGETE